jgi:hypothetical protein
MKSTYKNEQLSALYGRQANLQVELEILEIALKLGDQVILSTILNSAADTKRRTGAAMVGMSRETVKAVISDLSGQVLELGRRITQVEEDEFQRGREAPAGDRSVTTF